MTKRSTSTYLTGTKSVAHVKASRASECRVKLGSTGEVVVSRTLVAAKVREKFQTPVSAGASTNATLRLPSATRKFLCSRRGKQNEYRSFKARCRRMAFHR